MSQLETLYRRRAEMEKRAMDQINESMDHMRDELARVKGMTVPEAKQATQDAREPPQDAPAEPVAQKPPVKSDGALAVFCYPETEELQWPAPLRQALVQLGLLVYDPGVAVQQQFDPPDLPRLNGLNRRVVPQLCHTLKIPDLVCQPISNREVAAQIARGDQGEYDALVFKHQWFLARATFVLADLTRPADPGVAQTLLWARQLDIPTIGVYPPGGRLSPWLHHVTYMVTGAFTLQTVLPLVKGLLP